MATKVIYEWHEGDEKHYIPQKAVPAIRAGDGVYYQGFYDRESWVTKITREIPDIPTEPGMIFRAAVNSLRGTLVVVSAPEGNEDEAVYFLAELNPDVYDRWASAEDIDPETVVLYDLVERTSP